MHPPVERFLLFNLPTAKTAEVRMRKLCVMWLLLPVGMALTIGCGSNQSTVIQPTPEMEAALAAEAEAAEEAMETTEE